MVATPDHRPLPNHSSVVATSRTSREEGMRTNAYWRGAVSGQVGTR